MEMVIDTTKPEHYDAFLRVKQLPSYHFVGHKAIFPDDYANFVTGTKARTKIRYKAPSWMFDYQRDILAMAIHRRKFAAFVECGLGKTAILLEFARWAAAELDASRRVLIISPLMVVKQTLGEAAKFFGGTLPIEKVDAANLPAWLRGDGASRIGITNYDALTDDLPQGQLGGLILDESSMLKSHYGKWGTTCIRLGRGLEWKLCCTGTPAPNHALGASASLMLRSVHARPRRLERRVHLVRWPEGIRRGHERRDVFPRWAPGGVEAAPADDGEDPRQGATRARSGKCHEGSVAIMTVATPTTPVATQPLTDVTAGGHAPLTPKQAAVYTCIVDTLLATQHWPTVRELGRAYRRRNGGRGGSPNDVTCFLKAMERKGWLTKVRRGYVLVGVVLSADRVDGEEWPDVVPTADNG